MHEATRGGPGVVRACALAKFAPPIVANPKSTTLCWLSCKFALERSTCDMSAYVTSAR